MEMTATVKKHFDDYPAEARLRLEALRELLFDVAKDLDINNIEETLKWGEPSYSVKTGSPIRMDWKIKTPRNYYLYFHCQTKLVDTFRELYRQELEFQGNRAIVFDISKPLPEQAVKTCLEMALTYQQRKHLPLLGA